MPIGHPGLLVPGTKRVVPVYMCSSAFACLTFMNAPLMKASLVARPRTR